MKFLTKKAEVKVPKDLEEIVLEKYNSLVTKPWSKKQLEDNNAEKVLYNIIFKETKGKNIPISFKEIYDLVDKLLPKVAKVKEKEVVEQEAVKEETIHEPEREIHLETETKKASIAKKARFEHVFTLPEVANQIVRLDFDPGTKTIRESVYDVIEQETIAADDIPLEYTSFSDLKEMYKEHTDKILDKIGFTWSETEKEFVKKG